VKEEYIRWSTPCLGGRVFEMLVFGHAGVPVIRQFMQGHFDDNVYFNNPVDYWLDVWRWAKHDWPLWWDMLPRYLAKL
jgi:esterase/lipase superfamily enzyme